mmetsp:Transcript_7885/g.13291  ORF Transcript_7885/g.13291 Transcript_7885/m.13291 type:complete len:151 (-) Transcript_7885:440-892(-)
MHLACKCHMTTGYLPECRLGAFVSHQKPAHSTQRAAEQQRRGTAEHMPASAACVEGTPPCAAGYRRMKSSFSSWLTAICAIFSPSPVPQHRSLHPQQLPTAHWTCALRDDTRPPPEASLRTRVYDCQYIKIAQHTTTTIPPATPKATTTM